MDTYYCITAINRLTHTRERVSRAFSTKAIADRKCRELVSGTPEKRAYIYPQVEPFQKDLFIK